MYKHIAHVGKRCEFYLLFLYQFCINASGKCDAFFPFDEYLINEKLLLLQRKQEEKKQLQNISDGMNELPIH